MSLSHIHQSSSITYLLLIAYAFNTLGNEEAVRAYTMIDPIQRTLDDIEELMKYRNYQPSIDKITEVIEVRS